MSWSYFHARKVHKDFIPLNIFPIGLLHVGLCRSSVRPILSSELVLEHWKFRNWAQSFFLCSTYIPNTFQTLEKRIEWKIFQIAKSLNFHQKLFSGICQARQRPPCRPPGSQMLLRYGNAATSEKYVRVVQEEKLESLCNRIRFKYHL